MAGKVTASIRTAAGAATATAKHPPLSLPSIQTLPTSRRTLLVDRLFVDRRPEAFQLTSAAATRGDNVGVNEFPTAGDFDALLDDCSTALALFDPTTNRLEGLILVTPCRYVRSVRPTLCTVYVITDEGLSTRTVWRELVKVAENVARTSGGGCFSACVVDVFAVCTERMLALREAGFVVTACVPDAGKLAGYSGYTGNYLMYKDLGDWERPKPQPEELQDDCNNIDLENIDLVQNPNLPRVAAAAGGLEVTIRALRRDEIRLFYDALKIAIRGSAGYGFDELPSFSYFVKNYVNHFCNVVYETTTKTSTSGISARETMAYSSVGPSPFSRDRRSVLADGNAIVLPMHRGKKLAPIVFLTNAAMSFELGFKSLFVETNAVNLASLRTALDSGWIITGSIPKAIYFKTGGWTDLVTLSSPPLNIELYKQ